MIHPSRCIITVKYIYAFFWSMSVMHTWPLGGAYPYIHNLNKVYDPFMLKGWTVKKRPVTFTQRYDSFCLVDCQASRLVIWQGTRHYILYI
jgi:hypothetical protein